MIISPYIFSKIKRNSLFYNTSFRGKFSFKVSPKTFKSIYVSSLMVAVFSFAMLNKTMDIPSGSNTGITLPSIRANDGTSFYLFSDERHKGSGFYITYNFSPHLAASAQDAKHRGLKSPSASFSLYLPMFLAFVLPLAAYVCLIYFNRSRKDFWNIFSHAAANFEQSPVDTPAVNPCLNADSLAANSVQKPFEDSIPLFALKMKGKTIMPPFVFTTCATNLPSPYNINFFKRTSGTNFFVFHAAKYIKSGG